MTNPHIIQTLIKDCAYDFAQGVARLHDDDDLVGVGADLLPSTIVGAYLHGVFPWSSDPIMWYSPNPRCVIKPHEFQPKKSLIRTAKKHSWFITCNQSFYEVIDSCAHNRSGGTWIDDDIKTAYRTLFELGVAKSIEVWTDENKRELIGGLYGLQLGRVFCGESMFHRQTDASKIAFWALNTLCKRVGIELIDCQAHNDHLMSLGTVLMPRRTFLATYLPKMNEPSASIDGQSLYSSELILHKNPLP